MTEENKKREWDQQPDEKTRFYVYFQKYLQLGTTRSLEKLHKKHPINTPKIDRLKKLSSTIIG